MMTQIRTAFDRCRDTLIQDALGMLALSVMLLVGLHLPGLI